MTETLHRPITDQSEQLVFHQDQLDQLRTFKAQLENPSDIESLQTESVNDIQKTSIENDNEDNRPISSLAERIRNATERFASRLEERSIAKAHNDALGEYRDRDHSGYVDHVARLASSEDVSVLPEAKEFNQSLLVTEEQETDRAEAREALLENAEVHLRIFGNIALERSKDASNIALGIGVLGYQAIEKRVQTAAFQRTMNRDLKKSEKQYAKDSARFEKQNTKDYKALSKQAAKDSRQGAREDLKFERSMKRKATTEKIVGSYEKSVNYATSRKKKLGSFAMAAREVGAARTMTREK